MEAFEYLELLMHKRFIPSFCGDCCAQRPPDNKDQDKQTYSEVLCDGSFKIHIYVKEIARLRLYIEEAFGRPWSDEKIKLMHEHRNVAYYRYEKSEKIGGL